MEANLWRPSKYYPEERTMHSWWKQNKKLLNAEKLKEERVAVFERLLEEGERLRRVNQCV